MRLGDSGSPRLARKQGVILYLRGLLDDAEAAYERGRVDGSDPAEEAQLLAWHAAIRWIRADIDGCEALLDRAEVPAKASGDDAALATLHTTRAMVAAMRGDRRTNAEEYRRALAHAERAGDVVQLVRIHTNRGSHYSEEGNYQQALAVLDQAIEIAELIGSETFGHLAYYNRGETYFRIGRLDDALRDLHRAQQMWERLGSDDVGYALTQLGDVQLLRGQRSEAVALYRQAIELSERRGNMQSLVPALIGVAKALVADDPTTATAAAERAIAASTAVAMPHALAAAGWVALRSGRRDEAIARAVEAVRVGQAHQDRPAVAEALLLQAAAENPVVVTDRRGGAADVAGPGQPDRRGTRRPADRRDDLGPRARPPRRRRRAAAVRCRRVRLPRRRPARQVERLTGRHHDARRVPGEPGRRADRRRRLGFAQGARPAQAARRPPRRPGRPRRGGDAVVAGRVRTGRRAGCRSC